MLTKLHTSSRREARPGRPNRRNRDRLLSRGCEQLESRTLLTSGATLHWAGSASNLWSDPSNWQENQAPSGGEDLVFSGSATKTMLDDLTGLSVNSLTFQSPNYQLFGYQLALTGSLSSSLISGTSTIHLDMNIQEPGNADLPISVQPGGVLLLDGALSGSSGLIESGGGSLELAGATTNTYQGTTTVSPGTLTLDKVGYEDAILGDLVIDSDGSVVSLLSDQLASTSHVPILGGSWTLPKGGTETIASLTSAGGTLLGGSPLAASLTTGSFQLDGASTYSVNINGVATPGTDYDQVVSSGPIELGGATLSLSTGASFNPQPGDALTLIKNQSGNPATGTFAGLAEGDGVTVGAYTLRISYDYGPSHDVALIDPPPSTTVVAAVPPFSTYGQSVMFLATVSGGASTPAGNVVFMDGTTTLGPGIPDGLGDWSFTTSSLTAGSHDITAQFQSTGAMLSDSTGTLAGFTVDKAVLTISTADASKTYGQTFSAIDYAGSISGQVPGDVITAIYDSPSGDPAGATVAGGPYAIGNTLIDPGNRVGNYTIIETLGQLTVTPQFLTVTPADASKTYGQILTSASFGGTMSGLVAGDPITPIFDSPSGDPATSTVAGGPYAISATLSDPGGRLGNYTVIATTGQVTITPALLTVFTASRVKTYGQTLTTADYAGLVIGQVAGDVISANYDNVDGDPATATIAGGPYTIGFALSDPGDRAGNYTNNAVLGQLFVVPAVLTVVPADASKTYGQALSPADFTGTVVGIVTGDAITPIFDSPAGDPAGATVAGGPYTITAGLDDPDGRLVNYLVTINTGQLTIDPASLIITPGDRSKTYGQVLTSSDFSGSLTGLAAGDDITADYDSGAGDSGSAPVAGTPYAITVTLVSDPGGRLANYNLSLNTGALNAQPALLEITADDAIRTYGDANPTFNGQFSGQQNGEIFTLGFSTFAGAVSPVGRYDIIPSVSGATLANYTVLPSNGALIITPATLDVYADNASRVYGDPNPSFTGHDAGAKNGESFTLLFSTTAGPASPVATYGITPSADGGTVANYVLVPHPGTLSVTKALLTVTAADAGRLYGTANPAFSAVYSGFKNGETLATSGVTGSPVLSTTATAASQPGLYPIASDVGNLAAGNYTFRLAGGTLTVATAATMTTLESGASSSRFGQTVTFIAQVSAGPGGPTPTGTVWFMDGSTVLGSAVLSGSEASLSTNALGVGAHQIVAQYAGEGPFLSSQSPSISHTVSAASSILILSLQSPQKHKGIVLDASVPPAYPGGHTRTGSIIFVVNGRPFRKVAMVNGRAQWYVTYRNSLNRMFTAFFCERQSVVQEHPVQFSSCHDAFLEAVCAVTRCDETRRAAGAGDGASGLGIQAPVMKRNGSCTQLFTLLLRGSSAAPSIR
jgi:autotransporter-associated beta strand protein